MQHVLVLPGCAALRPNAVAMHRPCFCILHLRLKAPPVLAVTGQQLSCDRDLLCAQAHLLAACWSWGACAGMLTASAASAVVIVRMVSGCSAMPRKTGRLSCPACRQAHLDLRASRQA